MYTEENTRKIKTGHTLLVPWNPTFDNGFLYIKPTLYGIVTLLYVPVLTTVSSECNETLPT